MNSVPSSISGNHANDLILVGQHKLPGEEDGGGSPNTEFFLARLHSSGGTYSKDSTFGDPNTGDVRIDFSPFADDNAISIAYAALVQSNGKILVSGDTTTNTGASIPLARLNFDGKLDQSFNGTGTQFLQVPGATRVFVWSMAFQGTDKIILAGAASISGQQQLLLIRLNASDDSPDKSFGGDGIILVPSVPNVTGMVIEPNTNRIIIAFTSSSTGTKSDFALAALTANGALDSSFGTAGIVSSDFQKGTDVAKAVALQDDGKIVEVGSATVSGKSIAALARYSASGVLDTTFGPGPNANGLVTTDVLTGVSSEFKSVVIQSDGKIVCAGDAKVSATSTTTVIARYIGESPKTAPTITWQGPTAITYGTALSSAQLNASASVPGSFLYNPASGKVLHAGSGLQLSTTFTPTDTTSYTTASKSVPITVNKFTPTLAVHGVTAPADGKAHAATFTITATNNDDLTSQVVLTYNGSSTAPVQKGTYAVKATFAGNSDYNAVADTSQQVVITDAVPTITWAAPAAITYGTKLSATQLSAKAAVPGTYSFSPTFDFVLHAGAHQPLSVTFTADPSTGYTVPATAAVYIDVNKFTPVITLTIPGPVYDGNPHPVPFTITSANGDKLSSQVTVTYNGTAAAPVKAGVYTVSVTFPGASDYKPATSIQQLVIAKATPVINWANPAPIKTGTPLGDGQLNATYSVPGTLTYYQPTGTVLAAGSGQALSVAFTPTDTADYESVTAHVLIDVLAPPPPPPHVAPTAAGAKTKKGLTSITVVFDEPMNSSSVTSKSNYAVYGAVTKKKHTVYSKPVPIRTIIYSSSLHAAIITLSKPYKGLVKVTVKSGIMAANGAILASSSVVSVK